MSKNYWPELVFAHQHDAAVISRATRRGTLKRLARGIYSGAVDQDSQTLVRRFIWQILGYAFPGCVLVDASAMAADPLDNDRLFIAHAKRQEWVLPGITIVPRAGVTAVSGDTPMGHGVWLSSPPRVLLDYFALADHLRSAGLFHDWYRRRLAPESPATLEQLMARLPRIAILTRRQKALVEARAFIAGKAGMGSPHPQAMRPDAFMPPALSGIAKILGAALLERGCATRPELSALSGLSKPTVSEGIGELQRLNLVDTLFMQTPQKGRAAKVYGIAKTAGWVLGIDMGNYQALLIARGLDGEILAQRRIANHAFHALLAGAAALLATLQQELRQHGPLYAVTLALSQAVRQDVFLSGREGPSQAGLAPDEILARLRFASSVRLSLENNVNCAVAAEAAGGAAKGLRDVVFLQVGTHIGAGIIAGGQLIRGFRGCAGEVADIPFPWSATEEPVELMMEKHLGYPDYLHRLNPASPDREARRLPELLARADAGEPAARRIIQEYGKQVGYLGMGLVATLDPAMLVLGGPVGGHRMVCAAVRKQIRQMSPHTEVVTSFYGDSATAEGAVAMARNGVLRQLFGGSYQREVGLWRTPLRT